MTSRRDFLRAGIAATTLPVSFCTIFPSMAVGQNRSMHELPVRYKVIFDLRFSKSRELGNRARASGISTYGIEGDITDLWYQDLYFRWKQGPAAIAGLTEPPAIFCLERFAWDAGQMRVVHRADVSQNLVSWVIEPVYRS